MPSVAMLAVWMTSAVHMNGMKVRMVLMTSGLVVNSDGKKITMHAAVQRNISQHHVRALCPAKHTGTSAFENTTAPGFTHEEARHKQGSHLPARC